MIANPTIPAYRYNPYDKTLTREGYDVDRMKTIRKDAVDRARGAKRFGVVLGTLGRQGNPAILKRLEARLKAAGRQYFVLLLSEVFPSKLAMFKDVDAWIQVACPRLSIDWGAAFDVPLLSPYEAHVALDAAEWREQYPMDFYAKGSGEWTNYYQSEEELREAREARKAAMRRRGKPRRKKVEVGAAPPAPTSDAAGAGAGAASPVPLPVAAAAPPVPPST